MRAYKAFAKGLKCRGYKFKRNEVNTCPKAHCVACGFHAAENPLDCLSYYLSFKDNEFYIVECAGDIHEDGSDSKISCTELTIGECLTLERFVEEAIRYRMKHPSRKHSLICDKRGEANKNNFIIVEGYEPIAAGRRGDVLGFIELNEKGEFYAAGTVTVQSEAEEWRMVYGELQQLHKSSGDKVREL